MTLIKKILFLFITILLTKSAYSEESYGFKDIPMVYNLDSMDKAIPNFKQKNIDYIKHLITIELSRLNFSSIKSGIYIGEIDSLSKRHKFEFGIVFVQFYYCFSMTKSPNKLKEILIYGEPAMRTLQKLKDSLGIFYLNINKIRVASSVMLYAAIAPEKEINYYEKSKEQIKELYRLETKKLYDITNQYVSRQSNPAIMMTWNNTKSSLLFQDLNSVEKIKIAADSIKKNSNRNFEIIQKNPEYYYYLYPSYGYYSNSFFLEDSIEKGIAMHRLALNAPIHNESINRVLANLNLASDFSQFRPKENRDSIFKYAQEALNFLSQDKFQINLKDDLLVECYRLLSFAHELNGDTKKTNEYLNKMADILAKNVKDLKAISISTYFDFEKIRQQDANNKKLQEENRVNTLRILFGLFLLTIVSIALFFIVKSYHKLKNAKHKIELLQVEREKFYSILSHDLRSPVESFNGLDEIVTSLVKERNFDDLEKIAIQISKTSNKLKSLIENLLGWSLGEQQLLNINIQELNIKESIDSISTLYTRLLQEKEVRLIIDIGENITIDTDKYIFEAILRNIIDNGVKNSENNSELKIVLIKNENIPTLHFSNCTKIPPGKFQKLEAFFRSNNTWQIGHEGIGLGLFIIRDFARKLGYGIRLDYQNDRFTIELAIPPCRKLEAFCKGKI